MSVPVSRALALALLIAVFAGAYALVVDPLMTRFRANEDSLMQSANLLERYRRIGATRESLEAQIAALRSRRQSASGFLPGIRDTLAAADLQNKVGGIVKSSGGEIKSAQILPPRDEQDLKRINLRVRLSADISSLRRIIHRLESDRTSLFLTNLDVRGRARPRRRAKDKNNDRTLQVRFDIFGYIRPKKS